ncbi:MAG: energy-dependent translational throttle protein EttA [Planctomycetes bacterium]|nr:energy-dependent translational throttle protein EttA [Planctomycetota bacterium]
MGQQYIYAISGLTKKFGQREVLKDIWLSFYPGAKIGVLGRNGSGKSTLLRIMAGLDKDFDGEARLTEGFSVGLVSQEPQLNPDKDVFGNVEEAVARTRAILHRYDEINARLGEPLKPDEMEKLLNEQARVQDQIELLNAWELDRQVEIAMDAMQLPPSDADVRTLSGGERRRVALCKMLLQRPDLLLLDEPTNHLDAESVAWLERHLGEYPGTVVAVTHDRYFLDNVAGWILELDRGRGIPWEGNYSSWLEQKRERLQREEKSASARQKTLARELEWIRMAPRARQAKNKARIAAYEKLSSEAYQDRQEEFEIQIPPGKHLGELVVEAKHVSKGYGDRLLMEDLDFRLPAGGIVGVIGPNGVGKTTLFRMIVGQEQPDAGEIRVGPTVELGYVDRGCNLLLLDEPTNDLDVDTLRALEEAILNFAGCVVVISHDRWFLDRIATHILAFEGDSQVHWCEGNFQVYEDERSRRLGIEADQPHRIRYKKLTH